MVIPQEKSGKIHHCKIKSEIKNYFDNKQVPKKMKGGLEIFSKDILAIEKEEEKAYEISDDGEKWLDSMKKMTLIMPTENVIFFDLGEAYHNLGKLTDALLAHEIMYQINPYFGMGWSARTAVLFELEREPDIIIFLEKNLKIFLDNQKIKKSILKKYGFVDQTIHSELILRDLSHAYYNLRNNPKALEIIEKCLKIFEKSNSNDHLAYGLYQLYGKILLAERRNKDAKNAFEKSLGFKTEHILENESIIEENNLPQKVPKTDAEKIEEVEILIKNLIVDVLSKYPKWEEDPNLIPQTEWKMAERRKKTTQDDPILEGDFRTIDFVDFSDYIRIFKHKKNWEKRFETIFRDKDECLGYLKSIQKLRNVVAHNRGSKMNMHLDDNQKGHLHVMCKYFLKTIETHYGLKILS